MSEQLDVFVDINDGDEGAKLCKILETAAEPEVLMADMTSEQLFSFSTYQAKQKVGIGSCSLKFGSIWKTLSKMYGSTSGD